MTVRYDGLANDLTLKGQVERQAFIPKGCTVVVKGRTVRAQTQ